ncbi:MAG: hypothetical protein M1833_006414 [Piccolia ochrophora]|nr:MAG: hypothetical protein M1833_006414 [Piccolia ochrophora]
MFAQQMPATYQMQRDMQRPCDGGLHVRYNLQPPQPYNLNLREKDPSLFESDALAFQFSTALPPSRSSIASTRTATSWNSVGATASRHSSVSSYSSAYSNGSAYSKPARPPLSSRNSPAASRRNSKVPRRSFQQLPQEILGCIAEQLGHVHRSVRSATCSTCHHRDLHSLALTCKAMHRAARPNLYRSIWIVGDDMKKKLKLKYGARLKQLRRTLRADPQLAQYVRELKVPELGELDLNDHAKYIDLVASVVMSCPNLERLVGFYPTYTHEFDKLSHALSTRRHLKEQVWTIAENDMQNNAPPQRRFHRRMHPEQVQLFLSYHDSWTSLETLFLHSEKTGVLERAAFAGTFARLPSLKHLSISNFDACDFDDTLLDSLPPLQSLRLQDLHGISDDGLSHLASSHSARSLRHLTLINLEILSLTVIAKLFTRMRELTRFTLVQSSSPDIPLGGLVLQPIIGSSSLEFLHWDILIPGPSNAHLAASINAGGFPALRTLRAPSDHHGELQEVCRPLEKIALASDKFSFAQRHAVSSAGSTHYLRTLFAARQAAQRRIDEARTLIRFKVVVEEDGVVNNVFLIHDFMGTVGSKISYSLVPDVLGSDDAVIGMNDLLDTRKETDCRDGCTGLWNSECPGGKKWWSHRERSRWRRTDLERFF